jgi:nucleoid-associated protein YgaU
MLVFLLGPVTALADFDDSGAGARARAMGDSYTALSDDVFGMYYNPAGLGFVQTSQVGADFGKLYFGLDDDSNLLSGFTGFAFPMIKVKAVEPVSASTATATGEATLPGGEKAAKKTLVYKHRGTFGIGLKYFSLTDYYQESMYYLSYGRPVSSKWAWGISAKYLQEKYMIDKYLMESPVFDYGKKDSVSAMSVDAGLLYNIAPRFYAGLSVLDINQPDLGLKYEDRLPATVRTGIAWREKGLSWALDAVYREKQWIYSTGFEKFIKDVFGVRMGLGYGGRNYFNIAAGFSMNVSRVELDYAFQYPINGIKDTSGTHRMSLLFRFGRTKKEELEIGSLEYYYEQAKDDVSSLKQQLADTKNEKDNLERILIEESTLRIRERIKAAKAERGQQAQSASAQGEGSQSKEVRHIVRSGETLQSIAQKYFGDEKYWNDIYQANKDSIGRGGALKVNQVLVIPSLSRQETQSGPSAPPVTQIAPVRVIETPAAASTAPPKEPVPVKVIPIKVAEPEAVKAPQAKQAPSEPQAPARPKKHIVREGENLRSIAQKYYNDSNRWKDIYMANKSKVISGQVTPGQEITIP